MTATKATAPSTHFHPLPRFLGGGPGDHCCWGGHGGCFGGGPYGPGTPPCGGSYGGPPGGGG
ncbi:hypothetical protein [Mycolicibacterium pulveris]|uniref:hypothetical protein n=1 Tax=Mycolicibacterium pulveris TaxID=36813 RepID=UPI003CEA9E7F